MNKRTSTSVLVIIFLSGCILSPASIREAKDICGDVLSVHYSENKGMEFDITCYYRNESE